MFRSRDKNNDDEFDILEHQKRTHWNSTLCSYESSLK